ncbi:Bud-site selection protein [Sordaria brevicollis]|uniref:Bud-site selection protein n=1 Tax=Sordaria brevicollis TaxID=83679 RepID=A0AAE0UFW3_SORBR|nr:Bud-site selection protein [Sordaria brevicollis]
MQSLGKRKRTEEEDIEKVFAKYWGELHHALKTAKGFERQRQSKRLHDRSTPQDKKARIENEIVVLKSLDLYQAAHAHLCFSLLRIKRIAECPNLPEAVKRGVSKPVLTEEERTALHNVTSALCARQEVRTVTEKAIVGICKAMGIEPPEKKGKKGKKEKDEQPKTEEAKQQNGDDKTTKDEKEEDEKKDAMVDKKVKETEKKKDDKTKTKEKPAKKEAVPAAQDSDDDEGEVLKDEEEEKLLSKYDDLLGGSSSEESDADDEDDKRLASKAAVKKRPMARELDPMEITDDEEGGYGDSPELDPMEITDNEEAEDGDSEQKGDSEDEFEGFSDEESDSKQQEQPSEDEPEDEAEDSDSSSSGIDAAPSKKKSKTSSTSSTQKLQNFTMDSTFLPTLMGGYISGSESASDVDVAPARKNRRGQRARQAIWEKKFKEEAKHLKKMQNARDAGWDMKRGAVESDGKPWKKGSLLDIKNKGKGGDEKGDDKEGGGAPAARGGDRGRGGGRGGRGGFGAGGRGGRDAAPATAAPAARAPKKRDDSGPLHPSWEAKKKAKEKEKLSAPFQGKKITFD